MTRVRKEAGPIETAKEDMTDKYKRGNGDRGE